jgi:C-terminal processing protease CtpA/Prc
MLSRFQVVLDYQDEKIWLKPGRSYEEEYVFDRSGLNIIATGDNLNTFTVQGVLAGSPAAEADIRRGDVIIRTGMIPTVFLSLNDLQRVFQKKAGKKIAIVVKRDGKRLKKKLVLRDLI